MYEEFKTLAWEDAGAGYRYTNARTNTFSFDNTQALFLYKKQQLIIVKIIIFSDMAWSAYSVFTAMA